MRIAFRSFSCRRTEFDALSSSMNDSRDYHLDGKSQRGRPDIASPN